MMKRNENQVTTMSQIAEEHGMTIRTFYGFFSQENYIDCIKLGWIPHRRTILPRVAKYVSEVVINKKPKLSVFPDLADL